MTRKLSLFVGFALLLVMGVPNSGWAGVYDPPEGEAGPDRVIYEDELLTIVGSGTGTEPLSYEWDMGDGHGYSIPGYLVQNFDYDSIGTFVATLRVSDLWGGEAFDQCTITVLPRRHCYPTVAMTAEPSAEHPELGSYRYRMTIAWTCNTYRPRTNLYFESYWELDPPYETCTSSELIYALRWVTPAGSSLPECVVDYDASFFWSGTPVLGGGGGGGRLIGMIPAAHSCSGDAEGSVEISFYSNYPPETRVGRIAFWEEEANTSYTVQCEGAFPTLPCGAVATERSSWGAIKELFKN